MTEIVVEGLGKTVQMLGVLPYDNRFVLLVGDGEKFTASSNSLLYVTEAEHYRKVDTDFLNPDGTFIGLRLSSGELLAYHSDNGTWFFDDTFAFLGEREHHLGFPVKLFDVEQFKYAIVDGNPDAIVATT